MLTEIRPKRTILTHFGNNIYIANVDRIAQSLSEDLGIDVLAAKVDREYELI